MEATDQVDRRQRQPDQERTEFSRRQFLHGLAASGAAVVGSGLGLAACGSNGASSSTTTPPSKQGPKRGGTLRIGMTGGASSDSLDPQNVVTVPDHARAYQLFESLVTYDDEAHPKLLLAEEITPDSNATNWTVRVRPGVTFHNGKPLTAEDVRYSFARIMNPRAPMPGAASLPGLDVAGIRILDKRTVRIPFKKPYSPFIEVLPNYYFFVVPVDFNPKQPIGTGPFKYKSFSPGVSSIFDRYGDYWQSGFPYVDELQISEFADETSQVNALVANNIDGAALLTAPSIAALTSAGKKHQVSHGGGIEPFTMRVNASPFNDVRVRQAMRYLVDREEMLKVVFNGLGTVGNDITSIWDPAYDRQLPQRKRDVKRAKSLLRAAGRENLTIDLVSAPLAVGTTSAAQVFAQQASAAGVHVRIQPTTTTVMYGPRYLHWVFAQDVWNYWPYLIMVSQALLPTSPYNETNFDDSKYVRLYTEALATTDVGRRTELEHEMMRIDYEEGGFIIPYFIPVIDGYSPTLGGVTQSRTGLPFGNYAFFKTWLES